MYSLNYGLFPETWAWLFRMTVCVTEVCPAVQGCHFSSDYLPRGECDLSLKSHGTPGCELPEEPLATTLPPLQWRCLLSSKHPEMGLGQLCEDPSCYQKPPEWLPTPLP